MALLMICACFAFVIALKQPGVVLLIFGLQGFIYRELVQLAIKDSKERQLPGFRWFYNYWFATAAFFVYLRTFKKFLLSELRRVPVADIGNFPSPSPSPSPGSPSEPAPPPASARLAWPPQGTPLLSWAALRAALEWVIVHHEPLAYALYVAGFVAFVVSLRQRRNFRYQFGQFAYCHVALLLVVFQSTYLAANVYNGVIFFFVPCGLVVCNDCFAYVSGFFFGRTPLIRLSPKKTWEGFVGGAVATVVFAFFSTRLYHSLPLFDLAQLMACPVAQGVGWTVQPCRVDEQAGGLYRVFPLGHWRVGRALLSLPLVGRALAAAPGVFACSEMQLHAVAFAVFASVVAPFGGFFASGFKRAFRIKDFGAAIPGHGGFTDRMDCQLIMGSFSYIYCVYNMQLGQSGASLVAFYRSLLISKLSSADLAELQRQLGEHVAGAAAAVAAAGRG